jgi:hypothetical protein
MELEKFVEQLPTVLSELQQRKKAILSNNKKTAVDGVPGSEDRPLVRRYVDDDVRSITSVDSLALE